MKKNRIFIFGAVLFFVIVNLFASIDGGSFDEGAFFSKTTLSKILVANAENAEGSYYKGIRKSGECVLFKDKGSKKTYIVTCNGSTKIFSKLPVNFEGSLSIETHYIDRVISGIEYTCDGTTKDYCDVTDCYTINKFWESL